jgi:NAD(P)-dependent dehydrogenase (short-subunit alcohol dehydrogenase family)
VSGSWSTAQIPDQSGRTVLVTGTTRGGLGHHTALELARCGARVVLAGRSRRRLDETTATIRAEVPAAELEQLEVDLASLDSVRSAAGRASSIGAIHVLVNNAGVMAPPYRRTPDGFESQLATNHLGPFLLTGLLLPQLVESGDARIVTVSSVAHRAARAAPTGDPRLQPGRYRRWPAYSASKLANLLFTFEADRRLAAAGLPVRAMAAHPGLAGTHLAANGAFGRSTGGVATILDAAVKAVSQPAAAGAWPTLMAATAELPGSTYCGPGGFREVRGRPRLVGCSGLARDEVAQRRLWEVSEQAVGLRWP